MSTSEITARSLYVLLLAVIGMMLFLPTYPVMYFGFVIGGAGLELAVELGFTLWRMRREEKES